MRLVIDLQGAQGSSHARGIGRYSRELAMAMARQPRGHEIIVALSGAWQDTAEQLTDAFAGILPRRQIRVWHPPPGTAALRNSPLQPVAEGVRAQFLASLGPDLVHVCSLYEGLGDDTVTSLPPRLERLPVVATCYDLIPLIRHAEYFGETGAVPAGARWYYRCVQEMALCEGLLAISESSRGEAIRHLPFPPDRVFNIQAGIATEFRPAPASGEARSALLRRYGLRESFILFLGAGDIRKNEAGLIAAYAQLPAALRDRHQLAIVGRTDEAALHRTAMRLELPASSFVTVPFVAEGDLNALYSACGVFVFPSLHEGFGLPVAEAMACGAPVIASNNSSLPEVIGRADATFDALDPASIAACLRRVLEDPVFRAELAAYGPVQAGRFTWPSSAARAWDALEDIHARRTARHDRKPARVLLPRPRLAFVSPLPPQASGIADYSRDLLPSLARYYDITLVSEVEPEDIRLRAAFPRLDPAAFARQAGQFDRVVYQIGNSSFHRFQIEDLLPHQPGVVVLHDAFLSDYMHWLAHQSSRPDEFRAALWRAHGYGALIYYAEHGALAAKAQYPCSLPVLQGALGVIQHSLHGVDVLRTHFGEGVARNVTVIPLVRAVRHRPDRRDARVALGLGSDECLVVSFGIVAETKGPDILVEAWRRSRLSGKLVFAGGAPPELQPLVDDAGARISCTGRLTAEDYDVWLAAADVAVQWRRGSRGETSAAVADALMAGVPLIVNRHGSAAELPPEVALALPDEADAAALAEAILALQRDGARRAALSAAARRYALRELAPEPVARRYRDAIEQSYATPLPAVVAQQLAPESHACLADRSDRAAAARAICGSFPDPWTAGGKPRLLVDMSEAARREMEGGDRHLVREIGLRALRTPPPGYSGEAVRLDEGRLRHTSAVPLRLLGLSALDLPETPLDARDGDVLLCAGTGTGAALTDGAFAELRRLRLNGMRIALVVDDLSPLRGPGASPAEGEQASAFARLLGLADLAACTSPAMAEDLATWLDGHRSVRRTSLPIGVFQTVVHADSGRPEAAAEAEADQAPPPGPGGAIPPGWDDSYRQLCAIIFAERWHHVWRP